MTEQGVIYVASQGLRYCCEAIASAESLRAQVRDVAITLFTDMPSLTAASIAPFDEVRMILSDGNEDDRSGPSWGKGIFTKVRGLSRSPYRKTVFLDSDTRILSGDFAGLFDVLDDCSIAMVPTTFENSRGHRLLGPMFNSGVIAFRKDPRVDRLLARWEARQRSNLERAYREPPGEFPERPGLGQADRRFLLMANQTSLAGLLSPSRNECGVSLRILDDAWNARNVPLDRLEGVIVDHSNRHKIGTRKVRDFLEIRGLGHLIAAAEHTDDGHQAGVPVSGHRP